MRLLFMIPRLTYSGAPKIMAWIANQMANKNCEVIIVSMYESTYNQTLNEKVVHIQLNYKQSKYWLYRNTIGMYKVIKKYRQQVKKYKPDLILSFLDSVSYYYILLNKFFLHNKIIASERVDPYSRSGWRAKICFNIMNLCNYMVFQTEDAKKYFGIKFENKSCVIPNPVILNDSIVKASKRREKIKLDTNINKISFVGRLSIKQKRQDVMINAINELKNRNIKCKLYIYGSGADEKLIKKIIKETKTEDYIILMGKKDNIPEEICDSTCFVLTSDYEGIPNSLIEAMSIGIPSISTNCSPGGAKLLINNNHNGFLVERGNYIEIANKIEWIIKNPKEAKKIGEKGKDILNKFSEENISNMWFNTFCDVCKKK